MRPSDRSAAPRGHWGEIVFRESRESILVEIERWAFV
jgi:hypothetical protein